MTTRWLPALLALLAMSAPTFAHAQTEGDETTTEDSATTTEAAESSESEGDAAEEGDSEKKESAEGSDEESKEGEEKKEGEGAEGDGADTAPAEPAEPATPKADDEGFEPVGDDEPVEEKPVETKPVETKPAEPARPLTGDGPGASPIADLKSDDTFVPLGDIEEETLDPVFPATPYPYVEWHGGFRFRSIIANTFDLGTNGTSAILPPLEQWAPIGNPANPNETSLWTNNMRLRLEPTFYVAEELGVHLEADFLDNVVLGSQPLNGLSNSNPLRPDPSRNRLGSGQISSRESEWYQNPVEVNEAYGEISSFFGTLRVGRMDNHWGLGMFYNDGDCDDCDFGDHIDRIYLRTRVQGFYGALSVEYPAEGLVGVQPNSPNGAPNDLSQIDDAAQFTLQLWRSPTTPRDLELQRKALIEDRAPVINGGLLLSYRTQQGTTLADGGTPYGAATNTQPSLIYQGVQMFIVDGWSELLYQPDSQTKIQVQLEAMGAFGSVDNTTYEAVDRDQDGGDGAEEINCFDEAVRAANEDVCRANARDFLQLGVALRSKFELGGPVAFGLNGGFASGGNAANWGWNATNGADLDFFRFDPDYHVDLILFRNVIGTVTNAVYANPYLQASFLESGKRKLRLDIDGIISRAVDPAGTPAGLVEDVDTSWLGVELDGAVRYILEDSFNASLEGGVLFPLAGLGAYEGRDRLTQFGTNPGTFSADTAASTAWTIQAKLNWRF